MNDLIERLRSIRGNFIIPVESPPLFALAEEAADALEAKDAEIERLQRAYRPPDLVEYNALQARVEENERLTAELASKHEWCVNTDLANAELQAKVEELECSLTISRKKHELSIARVEELETALREIALDSDNPTNQRTWAAERADKALAATEREGE